MAVVREGTRQREVYEGRPNQVISTTDVKLIAVKFTDSEGMADVCLAFCWGKQADGKTGVFVIEPRNLPEMLRIAQPHVRAGVIQALAAQQPVTEEALSEGPDLGDIDLTNL